MTGTPFWKELLGNVGRHVRGALLLTLDGRITRSTLPIDSSLETNGYRIATIFSIAADLPRADLQTYPQFEVTTASGHIITTPVDLEIKTSTGYILATHVNKDRILAVIFDDLQFTSFKVNLHELFADESWHNEDPRQVEPVFPLTPPRRGSAHAEPEYEDE